MGVWVHRLIKKDVEGGNGVCQKCGPVPLGLKGGQVRCLNGIMESRGKTEHHGLGAVARAALITQAGQCAICKCPVTVTTGRVDHDHKTKEIRGILCSPCNTGLGLFKDDPNLLSNAIGYLSS